MSDVTVLKRKLPELISLRNAAANQARSASSKLVSGCRPGLLNNTLNHHHLPFTQ
jgi:hypothetical protein